MKDVSKMSERELRAEVIAWRAVIRMYYHESAVVRAVECLVHERLQEDAK